MGGMSHGGSGASGMAGHGMRRVKIKRSMRSK
jgi:hypothetical protein